ncbi:hypothetical protein ASPWEDRAFT_26209 [Aspergillus wentii DTO 134E9]|uniref:Peptide N-acetyl-beta-D-glucosaminyl asparaginase amidase A N-terminal domain-containing protein n=1 Tax=Aspergillus wentii DTO 134E9 TaxID=1073089 RepID=A0A1L9RPA1_ASPWE|nr:uncharacterized protein ASPWEDRAFT_26209 [Aspergillus wentii DTO 134E9]OJJ36754.1 hypothetical protein ASPWEDRAFT_26209 [Aspergillus wentii DTO 134E9]
MAVFSVSCCILLWLGYLPTALSAARLSGISHQQSQVSNANSLVDVFQVYQPIPNKANGSIGCNRDVLLMDHVFGYSYGKPFIGIYEPPDCDFDTVRINLTVTSRGRQFDRLASMYLGDTEVFRTSTAEPTTNGIVWTYIKEMSQYNTLWKEQQKLIFELGNLIDNTYTGSFNITLTAYFSHNQNVKTADIILPITARKSASNSSSAFTVPSDNTTVLYQFPPTASRAVVSISACGQSEEEFWWSNVLSTDTKSFNSVAGDLYGHSPFREIQLFIDGILAGVVWPFPVIFTGGVAPGFWRPIVGIDAFDLRQPEIDISPFLPLLTDGHDHSFEIRVAGLDTSADGTAVLSDFVGSYWVVTGNIFLYLAKDASYSVTRDTSNDIPSIFAPAPKFTVTRNLVKDQSGKNESLSYSVIAERTFNVSSSDFSWSQVLSYSNFGLINQQGTSQANSQSTIGNISSMRLGNDEESDDITFEYPLVVNTTYGGTDASKEFTIDASMKRGLDIEATGVTGISTYTLTSGASRLHTEQWGRAHYKSITGGNSTSSGDTFDRFESNTEGSSYRRSVRAIDGSVVLDTNSSDVTHPLLVSQSASHSVGRDSIRSILGRGPGLLQN